MIRFRRAIAACILALFACQSIMAGFDGHEDHSSDVAGGLHPDHAAHDTFASPDSDQPVIPDLIDSDCCHAHGHCHLLAFTGQVASVSIPPSHGSAFARRDAYASLSPDTLLRPPTHA